MAYFFSMIGKRERILEAKDEREKKEKTKQGVPFFLENAKKRRVGEISLIKNSLPTVLVW